MDALPTKRTWPPSCSHGTYQHEAITSRSRQLLMIGTWLPETCWTTIRSEIKNTKSDIYLVFFIHTELRRTVNHTSGEHFNFTVIMIIIIMARIFLKFVRLHTLHNKRLRLDPVDVISLYSVLKICLSLLDMLIFHFSLVLTHSLHGAESFLSS